MQHRHRLLATTSAGVLAAAGLATFAPSQSQATPPGDKTVTATMFERQFADVGKACTEELGPAGYGYVQVSPATEHIQGDQWWTSYQPVSYKIAGRLGDRAAFKSMVDACHQAGVKVIADAVINHMAAGAGTGTLGHRAQRLDPHLQGRRGLHPGQCLHARVPLRLTERVLRLRVVREGRGPARRR